MSVFDLFRGFFGLPGRQFRGDGRREPFFDGMTHDEDKHDKDAVFWSDDKGHSGDKEVIDELFRFGFSRGPSGEHTQELRVFGQVFREMESILNGLDDFITHLPSFEAPFHNNSQEWWSRRRQSMRDFMLKIPDNPPDNWSDGPRQNAEEKKEDGDLDSQVSSSGLDQILSPAPSHPRTRSFFQSVTVTKVVKPDGTVEERRTVRDGQGNEETTVTRSGPGVQEGPQNQPGPEMPGGSPLSGIQDESSILRSFFRAFRG